MYNLGQVFSVPAMGPLLALTTRKATIHFLNALYLAGWILIALTEPLTLDSVYVFYIARFLIGMQVNIAL